MPCAKLCGYGNTLWEIAYSPNNSIGSAAQSKTVPIGSTSVILLA